MTRSRRPALILAAALLAATLSPAVAEEHGGAETGGKKSAFSPGEHELQLPPLWVPVKGQHGREPGVARYRPVTVRLTSQHDGMTTMCHRLPYITEALLFAFNRDPIAIGKDGSADFGKIEITLLNEVVRVAGANAVKTVRVTDGVLPATKTNQDLLGLCQ